MAPTAMPGKILPPTNKILGPSHPVVFLRKGTLPSCVGPCGDVLAPFPHDCTRLHTTRPPLRVAAILTKVFKLFWAQKAFRTVCKLLRGLDLNQRPLGYEMLPDKLTR
jgi:hypothetical protein